MKTKNFRITWRDWKLLRQMIPGIRGETVANYMSRVVYYVRYGGIKNG